MTWNMSSAVRSFLPDLVALNIYSPWVRSAVQYAVNVQAMVRMFAMNDHDIVMKVVARSTSTWSSTRFAWEKKSKPSAAS